MNNHINNIRDIDFISKEEINMHLSSHDSREAYNLFHYRPSCINDLSTKHQIEGRKIYFAVYIVSGKFDIEFNKSELKLGLFKYFDSKYFDDVWDYVVEIRRDKKYFYKKIEKEYSFANHLNYKFRDNTEIIENMKVAVFSTALFIGIILCIIIGVISDAVFGFTCFVGLLLIFMIVGFPNFKRQPPMTANEHKRRQTERVEGVIEFKKDRSSWF